MGDGAEEHAQKQALLMVDEMEQRARQFAAQMGDWVKQRSRDSRRGSWQCGWMTMGWGSGRRNRQRGYMTGNSRRRRSSRRESRRY